MTGEFNVTFLGTSSGGGPSESRNCSSLVCDVTGNGSLWMIDCAEGTLRQFALQDRRKMSLKTSKVSKMFLTHMHADHIMGIIPFLRNVLYPPPIKQTAVNTRTAKIPKIEIYGPCGIRNFVRQNMKMTLTKTADFFVVHELLTITDRVTPCHPYNDAADSLHTPDMMHYNELPGQDIRCSEDGFWKDFATSKGHFGDISIDAGPILHRDPCVGYVIREKSGPMRKLVILGDTYDPSAMIPLCISPSPSLLIHEATDAHIPLDVDYNSRRSPETVLETVLGRGHSIPAMAGSFAKTIGAERLVLNHIGSRFPAPKFENDHRAAVMSEIERQATEAWGERTTRAWAAYDYMTVRIPPTAPNGASSGSETTGAGPSVATEYNHQTVTMQMQLHHADPNEGLLYVAKERRPRDWGRNGNRDKKRRT